MTVLISYALYHLLFNRHYNSIDHYCVLLSTYIILTALYLVNQLITFSFASVTVQPSASCYRHQAMQNHSVVT